MKKSLFISSYVVVFICGLVMSELILDAVNQIFRRPMITTRNVLKKKLDQQEKKINSLESAREKMSHDISKLIKDMNDKDYYTLTKEAFLSNPMLADNKDRKLMLKPAQSEMLLKPASDDNRAVTDIKNAFNSKINAMLGASKGLLNEKINKLNMEMINMNNLLKMKNTELNEKLDEVASYKKELENYKKYNTQLETIRGDLEKTVGDLETKLESNQLKVNFKGDILFSSGSHKLKKGGIRLLESVFPILLKSTDNFDIFIAGHTDNVPIKKEARDKYESNWELSTYRAIEVVKYLSRKGMDPKTLTAAGYGEYKPVADNASSEGKSRNRRVELFLFPKIIKRSTME